MGILSIHVNRECNESHFNLVHSLYSLLHKIDTRCRVDTGGCLAIDELPMRVEERQRAGDEALRCGVNVKTVARNTQQSAHLRHHVVEYRLIGPQRHVLVVDVPMASFFSVNVFYQLPIRVMVSLVA